MQHHLGPLISAAAIACLAGCAGQQVRLGEEDRALLHSQPVHVAHHVPARAFSVESTGYTALGVLVTPLVAGLMVAEGMGIQRDLQLEDPAPRVKERLADALRERLQLASLRMAPAPTTSEDSEYLQKTFGSGVVLEVMTRGWGLDNNRPKYSARARFVRLSDGFTAWQATCEVIADRDQPSPAREALVANGGELLKAKLVRAAERCAEQLAGWATGAR